MYGNRTCRLALNFFRSTAARLPETFPEDTPSLFIRGTEDEALPISFASETQLAGLFPGQNLKVVTLQGANHWLIQVRVISLVLKEKKHDTTGQLQ